MRNKVIKYKYQEHAFPKSRENTHTVHRLRIQTSYLCLKLLFWDKTQLEFYFLLVDISSFPHFAAHAREGLPVVDLLWQYNLCHHVLFVFLESYI